MLFAIGDLHLPGGQVKPMDVFGAHWENHFERIRESWLRQVSENDTVLIPGDISWAMQLEEALPDLRAIGALPGRKILLRGNHDYWWSSLGKVRAGLPEGMFAIQNDALIIDDAVVCGTRGWTLPQAGKTLSVEDDKIVRRESLRLEMTLSAARRIAPEKKMVVMMHFPPFPEHQEPSCFTDLLEHYEADVCIYGHLHGAGAKYGFSGPLRGVRYQLVSCDSVNFEVQPVPLG